RRNIGIERGIRDDVFLLRDAVLAKILKDQIIREPRIEDAPARAQHGLGRPPFALTDAPGNTDARTEIGAIGKVGLRFNAKACADGDIGPPAPVVLYEESAVEEI